MNNPNQDASQELFSEATKKNYNGFEISEGPHGIHLLTCNEAELFSITESIQDLRSKLSENFPPEFSGILDLRAANHFGKHEFNELKSILKNNKGAISAILIQNQFSSFLANLFISLAPGLSAIKFFTDFDCAYHWLFQTKKEILNDTAIA